MSFVAPFIILSMVLAAGTSIFIADMHRQAVHDVEHSLVGLSTVLADQADRSLQSMEMVQDAIIRGMHEANVSTPADFAIAASRKDMHLALKARVAALPQVNAITIVDRTGKLLNFTRFWPIPDINIADRDYFKALVADPSMQRFISQPVQNRGDGVWTIYVARKVAAPDGAFLGLVLGAVELGYFERLYKQITPAADAVVSVFRNDGMLLVRHPHKEGTIGKIFSTTGAALIAAKKQASGVLRNVSPIDGHERLIATKALANFPLILSISRTVEASLASFYQQVFVVGAAAVLITACIWALYWLVLRQSRAERRLAGAEERVRSEHELRTQYERFGVALNNMVQGLCLFDADKRLVVMNDRFAGLYAIPPDMRAPGTKAEELRHHVLNQRGDAAGAWDIVVTPPELDATPLAARIVHLSDDRSISVVRVSVPGGGWICTHEDVTERRHNEERLRFLARHDALTKLPNRVQFEEVVQRELAICARTGDEIALLCLDLDGFKQVNDLFGHPVGDRLLTEVAARLQGLLGERCVAARLGGDEFAILATGFNNYKTPATAAQSVIDALSVPYLEHDRRIDVGCSVGIASFPRDGSSYEKLLSASDMALYRAKAEGKGGYSFFEPAMDAAARDRHQLAQDLRAAIGTSQIELHYQPQYEVASHKACGFEALVRWTHPIRGPISPAQFVPIAEETGLIIPLGEWVLREACREAATWAKPLGIAVNISIAQFQQSNLRDVIETTLSDTGLCASRLELEVTESLFLKSTMHSQEMLRDLKALGVRISIDDFGTGYSSLATLQAFPFDKIKIDRSFVGEIGVAGKGSAIVRAIISLGESLNVRVIAEGIETEDQLSFLRQHRCAEIQGYLTGKPRPIAEYRSLLVSAPELRVA
ncbi:EAL domain-containing protein [Methylorubrum sp. SB2]|uniref:bifunctional diguanylate cyclase/phosphodiesterase n=1 Tax=Methylorubrum subtropicum TaxID=3138812 RepID=UPI00313B4287